MEKEKVLLFDLDGTIADTLFTVIQIYNEKVVPRFRCKPVDFADKGKLQQLPVRQLFKEYGINWFKLPLIVFFIKRQLKKQMHTIKPIEGITEVLQNFKQQNYTLGIVTSNSRKNTTQFLEQHQLSSLFDHVYPNRSLFGKDRTFNKMVKKYQWDKDYVLYIGDETRDVYSAHKAGIGSFAVSWGYFGKYILAKSLPDAVLDKPIDLIKLVDVFFFRPPNAL